MSGKRKGDQIQEGGREAGSPSRLVLLRLTGGLGEGAASLTLAPQHPVWHMAVCLYLHHLNPILNASKCHYTFL